MMRDSGFTCGFTFDTRLGFRLGFKVLLKLFFALRRFNRSRQNRVGLHGLSAKQGQVMKLGEAQLLKIQKGGYNDEEDEVASRSE